MKTKLQRLMFALFIATVCAGAKAQETSGSCGYSATWEYEKGTLTISGTGSMANYTEALTDNPWNAYREDITEVIIEGEVSSVGDWAFYGCTNLSSVSMTTYVESIGNEAFGACSSLTSIYIPDGVATIGIMAFDGDAKLESVCLGCYVKSIGNSAFSSCSNLKYLGCFAVEPPTVGTNAFSGVTPTAIYVGTDDVEDFQKAEGWSDFADVITYPHGDCGASEMGEAPTNDVTWSFDMDSRTLTLEGKGAIKTYYNEGQNVDPSLCPWNDKAFNPVVDYMWSGISTIVIGEGITEIAECSFAMQSGCYTVSLPSTLTVIGPSSLEECAFQSIYLPEGLKEIGGYAFLSSQIEALCLPSTVTTIGECAFAYCPNLASIGCYAAVPPALGKSALGDDPSAIAAVYVPSEKIGSYQIADGWSDFAGNIQSPEGDCGDDATWTYEMATRTLTIEGTGEITECEGWDSTYNGPAKSFNPANFMGYPCGIERVVIDEGITAIPYGAFYMEVGIKSVNLPSTLTAIGTDAFGECENIETITCNAPVPPTLAEEDYETCVFYANDEEYNQIPIPTLTKICVPAASIEAYQAALGWNEYADKVQIPNTTIGKYNWSTFYNGTTDYKVDDNTTVYTATLTGSTLALAKVDDKVIPAGNAVILKSEGVPVLSITTESGTGDFSTNVLQGSDETVEQEAGYDYYALAYVDGSLSFFLLNPSVIIPAGKAYLRVQSSSAPARWLIEFAESDTATKIAGVSKASNKADAIYTLQGQRITAPQKSGIYIVNGKKVFIR